MKPSSMVQSAVRFTKAQRSATLRFITRSHCRHKEWQQWSFWPVDMIWHVAHVVNKWWKQHTFTALHLINWKDCKDVTWMPPYSHCVCILFCIHHVAHTPTTIHLAGSFGILGNGTSQHSFATTAFAVIRHLIMVLWPFQQKEYLRTRTLIAPQTHWRTSISSHYRPLSEPHLKVIQYAGNENKNNNQLKLFTANVVIYAGLHSYGVSNTIVYTEDQCMTRGRSKPWWLQWNDQISVNVPLLLLNWSRWTTF